ncbi:MAG: glycosyltransferase [Candidatus Zhuqueibacterota bacterium]
MKINCRKVLMLAFFFPPLGGAGCQRPLKWVKYLPQFGWQAVVVTSDSQDYHTIDAGLLAQLTDAPYHLVRTGTLEITPVYQWLYKFRLDALARLLRQWELNFNAPDRRIGWLPKACVAGLRAIHQRRPEAILSSSAPFTSHLVALLLKKKTRLPWVADFRDEWTDTPYFLYSRLSRAINIRLEKLVLQHADCVISVNEEITRLLAAKRPAGERAKFCTIPNGFDSDEIGRAIAGISPTKDKFILTHMGSFYASRTPDDFLAALAELLDSGGLPREELEVRFVGSAADPNQLAALKLGDCVKNSIGFVAHEKALQHGAASAVLVLIVHRQAGKRATTGKLFEYLALGKPILGIGTEGTDCGAIIGRTGTGINVAYGDRAGIAGAIRRLHTAWKQGERGFQPDWDAIHQYDRRHTARALSQRLDALVGATRPSVNG